MQIREKLTSSTFVHEMTTENGGVIFDTTYKTITLFIDDTTTAGFSFNSGVYLLEFENTISGETTPFAKGSVSLEREVTR
jgi:hypothetical protein